MSRRPTLGGPTQPVPVVAYARVSMAREETISPQIQMDAIKAWAARHNRIIVGDPIIEEGVSGRTFDRRIQEAMERVEQGSAEEILVWKFSRFGRNTFENAKNVHRIEEAGGQLVSVTEEVDARTATGGFTRDMLFALANMESRRIGEGWREAQAVRLKAGLPHSGGPRFGYNHHRCEATPVTSAGHRIVHEKDPVCRTDGPCHEEYRIDPVSGEALRQMYRKYLDGWSLARIAGWCHEQAIPTPKGGKWRSTTVAGILDSGWGAGLIQVGVHRTGSRRRNGDREQEYLSGAHEPVITEEEWRQYRAKREAKKGDTSLARTKWPLSGVSRCGLCGGPMTCTTGNPGGKGKNVRGYILRCVAAQDNTSACEGVWRITREVEEALFAELDRFADELEAAGRRVAVSARRQQSSQDAQRKRIESQIKDVETGRARLIEAVVAGALQATDIAAKRAELDDEEARLRALLVQHEAPPVVWTRPQIRSFRRDWPVLPLETRREMVRLVVDRIVCHPDKRVDVHLSSVLTGVPSKPDVQHLSGPDEKV